MCYFLGVQKKFFGPKIKQLFNIALNSYLKGVLVSV